MNFVLRNLYAVWVGAGTTLVLEMHITDVKWWKFVIPMYVFLFVRDYAINKERENDIRGIYK
jgi:hypothetical protein